MKPIRMLYTLENEAQEKMISNAMQLNQKNKQRNNQKQKAREW